MSDECDLCAEVSGKSLVICDACVDASRKGASVAAFEVAAQLLDAEAADAHERADRWERNGSTRMADLKRHEAFVLQEKATQIRALAAKELM